MYDARQAAIFEPFVQADGSTTRRYGGTGLGLTITRQLVEKMGGRLSLGSSEGRGSTFQFTARFGLGRSEVPGAPATPPLLAALRGLPVLVVDDNGTNRRILFETFAAWGMPATAVATGSEALANLERASAERAPFALAVVDATDGFALAEAIRSRPALARTPIIVISSSREPDAGERSRRRGVAAHLTRPVGQSDLWDAVARALGAPAAASAMAVPTAAAPVPPTRPLRVLLAEDQPVNQRLAVRLLEKRGHHVVVAGTGRAAVQALEREPFDVVLMDVQMPEMDGFEATAAIRAREAAEPGRPRVPIVALTAHAMTGDAEKCRAVGMDDYVSKPVKPADLYAAMDRLVSAAGRPAAPLGGAG